MKFNQDKECNQASLKLADLGLLLLCVCEILVCCLTCEV